MLIREPVVAGQFYPGTKAELRNTVRFLIERSSKETVVRKRVKGFILPHAGYTYSGLVAAETVNRAELAEIFIILGPNHTGLGKPFSIMTQGKWKTPLGEAEIESALAGELVKQSAYLQADTAAHDFEHSIEVLLPFLQFFKGDLKFVPIIVTHASFETFKSIADDIVRAVEGLGLKEKVCVVASSDMTHYESQESAGKKDRYAIEAIINLNAEDLLKRVEAEHISMCGVAPACIMLEAVKKLGGKKAKLIRYQTSGDVTKDYRSVVGYAGISIV